jgi:hypothetical protein
MRWEKIEKARPQEGDTRVITKFLFRPRCIGKEHRWLEMAKISQKLELQMAYYMGCSKLEWVDKEWVD